MRAKVEAAIRNIMLRSDHHSILVIQDKNQEHFLDHLDEGDRNCDDSDEHLDEDDRIIKRSIRSIESKLVLHDSQVGELYEVIDERGSIIKQMALYFNQMLNDYN